MFLQGQCNLSAAKPITLLNFCFPNPIIIVSDNFEGTKGSAFGIHHNFQTFNDKPKWLCRAVSPCSSINISPMTLIRVLKLCCFSVPKIILYFTFYRQWFTIKQHVKLFYLVYGAGEFSSSGLISLLWGRMPLWPYRVGWIIICFVHFTEIGSIIW